MATRLQVGQVRGNQIYELDGLKEAVRLAAGLGTRMLPLTSLRPKCLMPVMNRPLLGLWLARLAGLGIDLPRDQVRVGQLSAVLADGLALSRRRRGARPKASK